MRFIVPLTALLGVVRASSWTFSAAKLDISGTPYTFEPSSEPIYASLWPEEKLKLLLTIKEDDDAKKPHQAMLLVKDSESDLEANLVIPVKSTGRGSLTVAYKDLGPLLTQHKSIDLTLVLGGFGETLPLVQHIATISLEETKSSPIVAPIKALRYGALPEITHTFREAEKMPPKTISIFFSLVLLTGLAGLAGAWLTLGVNMNAFPTALKNAPITYTVFLGSLFALEGSLFLYWTQWRIMTALAALVTLSVPAYFSGRSALRETESRRLAGTR
ncbi:Putative uncharacterized protein [Taphrina deformans PYCC 5710]|uniref:Ribophorin II C-terminal domain-containing protein n=1 Tax=Taphrina deformans (strain PYCC 5710 / ATCC 11124 / CBS 356.35 / IMI 108563 / JCM 9778 / NBRC 8474) TaxID=1097556 RepID=R4XFD9_TAPDE|nr:Putative uncharacterized protein [Taphrina deformans PYCC 5710]|eukprot:CCG83166.1 Putative uncharacterized protein [Taphrina deformans PYCC 5710]